METQTQTTQIQTQTQSQKRNKIIYWIFTLWLALGMVSTAAVQLLKNKDEVANFTSLGFPVYLMTIIGVWKILGVIAILIPKQPLLKEWAYAGFFFVMSGAILSHLASDHNFSKIFASLLLLVLTIISWYFRPDNRRFSLTNRNRL
ncbi:DoxX family protein [Chryseobacterium paridis]|uniref:DoxX family protein n=1 Tax=Chryseobacterium paridis TaxID=2800328 RepID=A0ABS1FWY5_9FLAO|nr:DoxX family protein [Chryseobacterium paridis]MBK1896763.1 DoxX family protein [Chryseobacterium paridis]